MKTAYLVVECSQPKKLFIVENQREVFSILGRSASYRISPIFSLVPAEAPLPPVDRDLRIAFYCYQRAFPRIGEILRGVQPEQQTHLWFGLGIASLIAFADEPEPLQQIKNDYTDGLRAYEQWKVSNGQIAVESIWLADPGPYNPNDFILSGLDDLDGDYQVVLWELQHSLNEAVSLCARFNPEQLPAYHRLASSIKEIVEEIQFLEVPSGQELPVKRVPDSVEQERCEGEPSA
jgi:hypothetical protein